MRRANYERESETVAFSGFLNAERQRILAAATPERRAQMEAAEESRAVYRAWNAVCSGTREGRHVTCLLYTSNGVELLIGQLFTSLVALCNLGIIARDLRGNLLKHICLLYTSRCV